MSSVVRDAEKMTNRRDQGKETATYQGNGNAWTVLRYMENAVYGVSAGVKPMKISGILIHSVMAV